MRSRRWRGASGSAVVERDVELVDPSLAQPPAGRLFEVRLA
jgi:hypothetical protein